MKIHAIETGKVRITESWREGRGSGMVRLANTIFDKKLTAWLPIYVWLIEHPEGLILIDSGIPADANKPIWFPPYMPLIQRAAQFQMSPELEIGPQLEELGFSVADIRWVIMTHLHQDHDGGLQYFPDATIIVSRQEWDSAYGLKGRFDGYLNQRWPKWLQPQLLDFTEEPYGPFASHYKLTGAGDVILVPTPGHSLGHLSVILLENEHSIFFAGDSSYSDEILLVGKIDGVAADPELQLATQERIRHYAAERPTVYLPSHDPGSKRRLWQRQTLPLGDLQML